MRTVFRNQREVCAKWAEQSQHEGRAGNVCFQDGTIYSYGHWWMGHFIKPDVVFIRNSSCSISTSGHQCHVRSVLVGRDVVEYCVPSRINHLDNVSSYLWRVRRAADCFWNCRESAAFWKQGYTRLVQTTRNYIQEFLPSFVLPALFGLELSGTKAANKLKN